MSSRPLHPDVALAIRLSAIMSRNRYTRDPAPVIDELKLTAGDRTDLLAAEAGRWAGYYGDEHTAALADALLEIPGAREHVADGARRRGMQWNGNQPGD